MKILYKWVKGVCEVFRDDKPEEKAQGKSVGEAIGNFVQQHSRLFLVEIHEDQSTQAS